MKHDKSWSYDQIINIKGAQWGQAKEIRVGVRDLSITDKEDSENIRLRKRKDGLEIRVYSRIQTISQSKSQRCDLGHDHPAVIEKTFQWMSMEIPPDVALQLSEWLTDGHYKWKD